MFVLPQAIRFRHASRNLLLQLNETQIGISVLADYPGWGQMREDVRQTWKFVREVAQPLHITQLGLRYINRVERGKAKETADRWFIPNDFVPPAILRSLPPFVVRTETKTDDVNRTNVTLTHQEADTSKHGAFLLDIDRVTDAVLGVDTEVLLQEADRLHDDVWQVFTSTMNDRLERLLKGELP